MLDRLRCRGAQRATTFAALRYQAQKDPGRSRALDLLGCLGLGVVCVSLISQSNHRQGHVDLLVNRASLHDLGLAVIWNSRQCCGADRTDVIRGQGCGVKEPQSGQASIQHFLANLR